MKWLTDTADMKCGHYGKVMISTPQSLVYAEGKNILVGHDPIGKVIVACPNISAATKPCTATLIIKQGYSDFISINGKAICLDTLEGITDGAPGPYSYTVHSPGQQLVEERS